MKKMTLAMSLLLVLGVTACSGGNSTGAIPKSIQPGAVVNDNSEEVAALQAKLAQAEKEAQEAKAALAQQQGDQTSNDGENAEKEDLSSETNAGNTNTATTTTNLSTPKTVSDYLVGETAVSIAELKTAIEHGTALQKQAQAEAKNINSLIGAAAKLPEGTVLSTSANQYGGYAVIRETYSDTIGGGDQPFNRYVAVAKTATADKNAVVDATYKGTAAYSTGNMITLMEKTNQGEYQFELTLNVKDNAVSGGITNTNAGIQEKRAELGQPVEMISFKQTAVSVKDNVVGFNGDAQFNYGWGFLPSANGDGKGTYQGTFTGENAEEVVGTFSTLDTQAKNSVQGAFVGAK